ncbi:MAG TPA: RICIN domain-containing protein [Cytophagales bacterium]|nr:RICIN domain-containing protein [Cytophagales bacterium]
MKKKPTIINAFLFVVLFFASLSLSAQTCNCKYTVPLSQEIVDGSKLNIGPGDVVCIQSGQRESLWFQNFTGTAANPIIFKNCGGQVVITNTNRYGISFSNSKHFKLMGNGSTNFKYGIKINGVATVGLSFNRLSTDFETAYIEVYKSLGPGLMAKTDPECGKPETWKGNFVMRNVNIHDFYVHDVGSKGGGGEGFYIGHSFFEGISTACGKLYPHTIENIKVHNNTIENTVFDGMQVSCATSGVEIYSNTIKNYGTLNNGGQQTGLVIGGGSKGRYYNNKVDKGTGPGVCIFGQGDIHFYNNSISNTGLEGIFIDDRSTDPNLGLYLYNNTVVNSKMTGILTYDATLKINVFYNNLVVNPGNWEAWGNNWKKAFIYLERIPEINKIVKYDTANNYFVKEVSSAQFVDPANYNFHLKSNAPVINRGKDLTYLGIIFDQDNLKRPSGNAFDIGAYEYGGTVTTPTPTPTSLVISTTATSALCNGASTGKATASASGGTSPYTYAWSNGKTTQNIEGLSAGNYTVTVTDGKGVKGSKTVTVGQPSAISITNTKVNATSATKGSINITVAGGVSPYTYSWSNGATTQDISNLSAGTYTVTVKDKNLCSKSASIAITQSTTTPPPPTGAFNGVYNIISKKTGRYLEVANASTSNNANIAIGNNSNTNDQKWTITPLADGYYKVISVHSNKSMDATGVTDGSNIIQNTPSSTDDCQEFKIVDVGSGYYKIIPKCTGRGFEVKGNSLVDGALVGLWTYWGGDHQKWRFQLVSPATEQEEPQEEPLPIEEEPVADGFNGSFNIISVRTGRYLEVANSSTAENASVVIKNKSGAANQKWNIQALADGSYKIVASHSNKSLDVTGVKDGSSVIQASLSSSDDCQRFDIADVGGGYYKIIPKCGGRAFEVKANSTADGAPVGLWSYWGGDHQKWKLQLISSAAPSPEFEESLPIETAPEETSDGFNGAFNIISKRTGRYLEVANSSTAENASVVIKNKSGGANQKWDIQALADGSYKIVASHSNKSLDVTGVKDGSSVIQTSVNSSDDCQRFSIVDVGGGYYKIIPNCGGRAFEVKANSTADGAPVGLWSYWGGDHQKWKIQAVNSTSAMRGDLSSKENELIKVYPNPVTDNLLNVEVNLSSQSQEEVDVSLVDAMSLPVSSSKRVLDPGRNLIKISTSQLKGGVYFVIVQKGADRIVKRVVITR